MSFAEYLREGVLAPLGMADTSLDGSPAAGRRSTAADLSRFAAELQNPSLLAPSTLRKRLGAVSRPVRRAARLRTPAGQRLGPRLRDPRPQGAALDRANSSPNTFGHFGQSGTFLWVDPDAGAACVALTDRAFGPWAAEAWPKYTDAVLAELEP